MSDDKKPAPQEQLTMKQVVEQLIPAAIAAAVSATNKQQPAPAAQARPVGAPQRCPECSQQRSACEGKHIEMVVYPTRYPEHADYFVGVMINGIKYLSNDDTHKVLVPENAAGAIKAIVQTFEQNEHDMATGRKAQRHSGVVSPHGAAVNQATAAWR